MHAVVIAGGAGSRFWPASRAGRPKPFVPLIGGETLFSRTLARLSGLAPPSRTWVVTAVELEAATRSALRSARRGIRLLVEPRGRNTAAAIAFGAAKVAADDPEALIGVFPADHHISSPAGFARTVTAAARVAARGEHLVLVGIEPSRPDTAYGYLRLGEPGPGASYRLRRFEEKPTAARALRFINQGGYLWNAGMVVARADRILQECRAHAPEVWAGLGSVLERTAAGRRVGRQALARAYQKVQPISFDHAVLERSSRTLAVRGRFGWSDLGSWDSLGEHLPERAGNRVAGTPPVVTLDSSDNVIWNSTDRALALVGVEGYVVVNTDDALLVCPKERAQDVRQIVDELKRRRRRDLT